MQHTTGPNQSPWASLRGEGYISLVTFRKSGEGVSTTVWFAELDGNIVVYTGGTTGKVKRIRRNPQVELAASGRRGKVHGPVLHGVARLLDGTEARRAEQAINQKYPSKCILDLLGRVVRLMRPSLTTALIEIRPADSA